MSLNTVTDVSNEENQFNISLIKADLNNSCVIKKRNFGSDISNTEKFNFDPRIYFQNINNLNTGNKQSINKNEDRNKFLMQLYEKYLQSKTENIQKYHPLECPEYSKVISKNMKKMENIYEIPSNSLSKAKLNTKKKEINDHISSSENIIDETEVKLRAITIDWMYKTHLKLKLEPDTFYLAINYFDRFSLKCSDKSKYQLYAVTSLFIASKFEEIYPPVLLDFVESTSNSVSKRDILKAEVSMLNLLDFELSMPTPYFFLQRYSKLCNLNSKEFFLAQYIVEMCLLDSNKMNIKSSDIALGSIYLTGIICKKKFLSESLLDEANIKENEIQSLAQKLKNVISFCEKYQLSSIEEKFSKPKFMEVSKTSFQLLDIPQ